MLIFQNIDDLFYSRREQTKKLIIFGFQLTQIIMQQVYHSNAVTNLNICSQIQKNSASNIDLAARFNASEQTISKWNL